MKPILPPTYLLSTNLQPDELQTLENEIEGLTWDIREAHIILGKISRRERALFELRKLKLLTDELPLDDEQDEKEPDFKRRKLDAPEEGLTIESASDTIKVVKLSWWTESRQKGYLLPVRDFLLYRGRKIPAQTNSSPSSVRTAGSDKRIRLSSIIPVSSPTLTSPGHHRRRHETQDRAVSQPPSLVKQSTSEHEIPPPPIPDFLHTTYSCQRPTPVNPPNEQFIDGLKEIRMLRLLQGDQIGVRAYSSSIASLSAYPHALQGSYEVERLPGCGHKIAELFQHFKDTESLKEIEDAKLNEKLGVFRLFYDIWGVGDTTARDFYNKGWRDVDDIVEYGWNSLSRVQQIGVKYYEEFQDKIPRAEVEAIGNVILAHAREIDAGFQMTIVGGYRRGKMLSGDVDVLLSHVDPSMTLGLINRIVVSLEKTEHITHTLSLSTRNSERGQETLPWRGEGQRAGSGFDTLDKAMVVWRDPDKEEAPHRRVDIIVSPWKTVGCAVLGWSGATTFQRDLRRYCKAEMKLKFDSSGVRNRENGSWVDLEGGGSAPDMETAEKRVFEGLNLPWRSPEERCTG